MKVTCTGTARIRHKDTGEVFEISAQELDWDEQGTGAGSMGVESQHKAEVDHPELGTIIWKLGEYPVGVEDYRETDTGEHALVDDLQYSLAHEPYLD